MDNVPREGPTPQGPHLMEEPGRPQPVDGGAHPRRAPSRLLSRTCGDVFRAWESQLEMEGSLAVRLGQHPSCMTGVRVIGPRPSWDVCSALQPSTCWVRLMSILAPRGLSSFRKQRALQQAFHE